MEADLVLFREDFCYPCLLLLYVSFDVDTGIVTTFYLRASLHSVCVCGVVATCLKWIAEEEWGRVCRMTRYEIHA